MQARQALMNAVIGGNALGSHCNAIYFHRPNLPHDFVRLRYRLGMGIHTALTMLAGHVVSLNVLMFEAATGQL
uniref:Uncharacterized protein n=1 Tax=Globodera rostochiensis TaxID=31243 RepID=A0A914GVV0_GLORO